MKHIDPKALLTAAMFVLAPAAIAQDPARELATAIAAEEQENDYSKAERLYREAMADAQRGADVRALAKQRLAALLRKLDRRAEAQSLVPVAGGGDAAAGQDPERTAKLRAQARELLREGMTGSPMHPSNQLDGFQDEPVGNGLMWIGEPAVPEVIAAIESWLERGGAFDMRMHGLFQFLWKTRGPVADAYLKQAAANEQLRGIAAATTRVLKEIDLQDPVLRVYVEHEDDYVMRVLASNVTVQGPGGWVQQPAALLQRLDGDDLLKLADGASAWLQARILERLSSVQLGEEAIRATHDLVAAALESTDPDLGRAAEGFLFTKQSQQTTRGVLMLLDRLPELHRRQVGFWGHFVLAPSKADAAVMLPTVERVVERLGVVREVTGAVRWLNHVMGVLLAAPELDVFDRALRWCDMGYDIVVALAEQAEGPHVEEVLRRIPRDNTNLLSAVLRELQTRGVRPSPTAWPILREVFGESADQSLVILVARFGSRTGSADVAAWLVGRWRDGTLSHAHAMTLLGDLLEAKDGEEVRDAVCETLADTELRKDRQLGVQLLRKLIELGDPRALDLMFEPPLVEDVPSTLVSVLSETGDGYTVEQATGVLRRMLKDEALTNQLRYGSLPVDRMPDTLLLELSEIDRGEGLLLARLEERLAAQQPAPEIAKWFRERLTAEQFAKRGQPTGGGLGQHVVERFVDELAEMQAGDAPERVSFALRQLAAYHPDRIDVPAMLAHSDDGVRRQILGYLIKGYGGLLADPALVVPMLADEDPDTRVMACQYFAAALSVDAVPSLLPLLRDTSSSVREAAADALTKIRFYHEQRAHWDRIRKGLDASAASATEKLLLQAKPGADHQQRVLAIRSLGVLGEPEALPFLIEWSQEADEAVATEAKAAITRIHLGEGR